MGQPFTRVVALFTPKFQNDGKATWPAGCHSKSSKLLDYIIFLNQIGSIVRKKLNLRWEMIIGKH